MRTEISTRGHIETLVNSFYQEVRQNSILGYIFEDRAKVDWQAHLPKMYDFWASILLGDHSYAGNPMLKHLEIAHFAPMGEREFSEWIRLFDATVDHHFQGEKAVEAKMRASNIARLMQHKIASKGGLDLPFIAGDKSNGSR